MGRLAAHLAVSAHGQTGEVTQQAAQVLFKQTAVGQVLSRQVDKLVGVHHLAWRQERVELHRGPVPTIMSHGQPPVRGFIARRAALLGVTSQSA